MNFTEEDLKNLASQLSKPEGEMGVKVGQNMEISNANMTAQAILALQIADDEKVLEIGPGNGQQVESILHGRVGVKYTGVDISELMVEEATKINEVFVQSGEAVFSLSDGRSLRFADQVFDKILTVNTVYFWKEPHTYAREIYRVLKTGGCFALTFAERSFMEKLPFTKFGFTLYDQKSAVDLLVKAGFEIHRVLPFNEKIKGNMGEFVERDFLVVVAGRSK